MQRLWDGRNRFTWLALFGAAMKKQTPPDKLGPTYMLCADQGASNTDSSETKKTDDNNWVVTCPYIMIVGAGVKDLGLPDTPDANPTKPYLMWADPCAHAMIPVGASPNCNEIAAFCVESDRCWSDDAHRLF